MRKLLAIKMGKAITDNKPFKMKKHNKTQNVMQNKVRQEFKRKVLLENL